MKKRFVLTLFAATMMSSLVALAQSPNCTTIPSASSITDHSGIVWTLDGSGNSYENGTADGGADIGLLLYFNSNMYADTHSYGWFEHSSSSGWYSISGDPRGSSCSSPNGTTIPSASSITDNSGVVWTLDGSGNSYENGTADGGADISLLLWYNGNIYADTSSYGWFEHSPSSGWYSISGDPRGGGVTPYGVSAPSGYHWTTTFDDEFRSDSSINTSYWNGGASNTDWCDLTGGVFGDQPGGTYNFGEPSDDPCESNYGGLAFDSTNGLTETTPEGGPSAAIQTGGTSASNAKFIQTYGYWEARIKVPNMSDGGSSAHSDFWMHAIPEGVNSPTDWSPEFDVGERPTWLGSGNDNTKMAFAVLDYGSGSGTYYTGDCCGDDLSQDWHTYGLWWYNDGSGPYGSVQMYLDGTPVFSSPYVLNSGDTNLANGIYTFLSLDDNYNSPNDPFRIQYVRVWRLDSN